MTDPNDTKGLPLSGRTIVVTRRREQAKELTEMFERNGAHVLAYPAIEVAEPPQWNECDSALERIGEYSGVIFTSVNAVDFFIRRAAAAGKTEQVRSCALFPVGGKTKRAIESYGMPAEEVPDSFQAGELAAVIARGAVKGKKYLFPKGNRAREEIVSILSAHGAAVDSVIVYRTQEPVFTPERERMLREIDVKADLLTFFSPSSVQFFFRRAPQQLLKKETAVIGETTAAAARTSGCNVVLVAPAASSEEFVRSIRNFYSSEQRKRSDI